MKSSGRGFADDGFGDTRLVLFGRQRRGDRESSRGAWYCKFGCGSGDSSSGFYSLGLLGGNRCWVRDSIGRLRVRGDELLAFDCRDGFFCTLGLPGSESSLKQFRSLGLHLGGQRRRK
jgi:hypothetical protein